MDRRRHRRQTSNNRRAHHLRSLQKPQRVLARSAGESLRQVWTSRLCDSAIFFVGVEVQVYSPAPSAAGCADRTRT